jgi:Lytic polysaccharide mono-oxygenase, cellulose-degrading
MSGVDQGKTMITALLCSSIAHAHIELGEPEPRYATPLKDGPCGKESGDARGDNVVTFAPGETITVRWKETVDHPSHYRISFDDDGTDDFVDPATPDEFYSNDTVLLDDIPDEPDLVYAVEVTLPDITCSNCTLQLIQVMYDKPPYVPGTNDLYYQCADLELVEGGGTTAPPTDTGTTGGTTPPTGSTPPTTGTEDEPADDTGLAVEAGCSGCAGSPSSAPWWAAGVLLALAGRRRA